LTSRGSHWKPRRARERDVPSQRIVQARIEPASPGLTTDLISSAIGSSIDFAPGAQRFSAQIWRLSSRDRHHSRRRLSCIVFLALDLTSSAVPHVSHFSTSFPNPRVVTSLAMKTLPVNAASRHFLGACRRLNDTQRSHSFSLSLQC